MREIKRRVESRPNSPGLCGISKKNVKLTGDGWVSKGTKKGGDGRRWGVYVWRNNLHIKRVVRL